MAIRTWQCQCCEDGVGAGAHRLVSENSFPVLGSGRDKLAFAVRQVMLANAGQRWLPVEFRLREQFAELLAGNAPTFTRADSDGRNALIQCGIALQHLKLTLKRHGSFGRVDLFPDLDQPDLAARVHLGRAAARDHFESQLLDAMESGDTSGRLSAPVSGAAIEWLNRAMSGERSWVEFARCESSRQRLVELVRAPKRMRATEVQVRNERTAAARRWRFARLTDGMFQERLAWWLHPTLAVKVHTAANPGRSLEVIEPAVLNGTFAVVKTKTDDKHGWLAAGQTLAGLLLHARRLGLPCAQFLHALNESELRAELRTAVGRKGFMQVIVCFTSPGIDLTTRTEMVFPRTETRTAI